MYLNYVMYNLLRRVESLLDEKVSVVLCLYRIQPRIFEVIKMVRDIYVSVEGMQIMQVAINWLVQV